MRYTVIWTVEARDELVELWLRADSAGRNRITASADVIDRLLAEDPEAGESRWDDRRILIEAPLAVFFRVAPDDRKIFVVKVWKLRMRSGA